MTKGDAAHGFRGCMAGIHAVSERQGLMANSLCLSPEQDLSPGQQEEIERVCRAYSQLSDDEFVQEHLTQWLD